MLNLKRSVKNRTVIGRLAVIAIVVTFLASIGIVWLGGANPDSAGVPHLLSYQGVLADNLGDPVPDGTYQMTFSVYENATGGSALWFETRTVQVTDGRFSILLGNVTPIPPDIFLNGSERWLGVQVESDAEMTPRLRLASVAYAYVAEYTRNPLAPGQGLVITDADGNVTHRLNANGTSWHAGLETFDGGINVTGPHQSPHWTCTITDKGSYYRDENGVLREEALADGTHRQWDENGKKRYEAFVNGTRRQWDENGVLRRKENGDGDCEQWDENGTLRYRYYFPAKTERWDENGTIRYERIDIGPQIAEYFYDKNVKLRYFEAVNTEDKISFKEWRDENGDLVRSEEVDSETGKKTVKDGTGKVIGTESMSGSSSQTGTHTVHTDGQGTTTVTTEGVEATTSGGDKTIKISSTNGLEIRSTAGWKVVRRPLPDPDNLEPGYIEEYFDENGTKRKEVRATGGGPGDAVFTHIEYDQAGNVVKITKSYPNGQTIVTDGAGNVIRTESINGSSSQTGKHTYQATGSNKKVEIGPNALKMYNAAGDLTAEVSSEIGCAWFEGKGEFADDVEIDGKLTVHNGLTVDGGTKSAVVSTRNYGNRTTYCDESAEVYFFDRGEAHLDGGVVTIELDPIFLETVTIDDTRPMLVQITPTAECNGLYVSQRTTTNFTVRELQSGSSDAGFMWEVAAKRIGYEDTRLAEAN
ncbi:MAG: hypothetical protein JW878_11120 [Methanomicrobia archaeon]|nr:hypothetical protein [Methanomicrobia archaeon]